MDCLSFMDGPNLQYMFPSDTLLNGNGNYLRAGMQSYAFCFPSSMAECRWFDDCDVLERNHH